MKIGVIFMAYGTPSKEEEVLPYFTDILGGKKPSDEMLQELIERYRLIGASPLAEISKNQATEVLKKLEERYPNDTFVVTNGYRHIAPFVGEAVQELVEQDVEKIIGCALTPQYAIHSTQLYHDAALEQLEKDGSTIPYIGINEWHEQPAIIKFWANELSEFLEENKLEDYRVIFSAHNLPAHQTKGDVYQEQFEQMGKLIAKEAGVPENKLQWAWQSGSEGGPIEWMRPFLEETVEANLDAGIKHIISIPIGFISDNLEIFYDLDIELKEEIEAKGGTLHRMTMPNTDPLLIEAIADVVSEEVEKR